MSSDRILIIGGGTKMLKGAKDAGLEVLSIQKRAQFKESLLAHADKTFLFEYEDTGALLAIARGIYEAYPFQWVISMTETGLIPAAMVNDALGLPGNSAQTARVLKDKWAMRQRLNELGVSPVAARPGKSRAEIAAFLREVGSPIIVKPVDGAGSYGIFRLADPDQIDGVWHQMQELKITHFLMEEFLDGAEVSVEAFTFHGRHVVIAMTDKLTLPNFVEVGHSVPAQISRGLHAEIVAMVTAMLDAVGLKEGPSHTELRLTNKGPRILESHNRVGGDKIHDLVELACGVDMVALASAHPFGRAEELPGPPPLLGGAAIRFFTPAPGAVTEIQGLEEVGACPGVAEIEMLVQVGSKVGPVRYSPDRSGYLVTKADTVQEAIRLCEEMAAKVHIKTE